MNPYRQAAEKPYCKWDEKWVNPNPSKHDASELMAELEY